MRTPAAGPGLRLAPAELWRLVAVARPWLAGAVAVGVGQAVLLVAQAAILARLLADALYGGLSGHAAADDVLLIALLAVGRGVLGWAWEACTEAAARRARAATRRRALATAIGLAASAGFRADEQGDALGPGGMTTLIGYGVDDLDPFVSRVLPGVSWPWPFRRCCWPGSATLTWSRLAWRA